MLVNGPETAVKLSAGKSLVKTTMMTRLTMAMAAKMLGTMPAAPAIRCARLVSIRKPPLPACTPDLFPGRGSVVVQQSHQAAPVQYADPSDKERISSSSWR